MTDQELVKLLVSLLEQSGAYLYHLNKQRGMCGALMQDIQKAYEEVEKWERSRQTPAPTTTEGQLTLTVKVQFTMTPTEHSTS